MHRYHGVALLLVLLSIPANASGGQFHARKRDASATTGAHNGQITTHSLASSTSSTMSSSDATSPAVTPTTSMVDIDSGLSHPQTTSVSSSPTTANGTVDTNDLPIQPTITPALGVTGVVLITSGLAYCLIGIKKQWMHVFLSTAFLTSLSVTVLIEYVMSPPVSDAIQGAYFVAAFCTGTIFGAFSLLFKELTEGLGCLLGGFCFSMWLLSLKAGSLLSNSNVRGAFIGAFCVGFYALSFSTYTRPYALIASTAFAGSAITVLGIDCFSRAGWKEFWMYIWGLNASIFPLGTSSYPVTRGIRVELAVTIVICLLGLLSQIRLWKLIRERRKKQEELLAEERRKNDEAEAELGRAIEDKKESDLARWEAIYGESSKSNDTTVVQTPVSEAFRPYSVIQEAVEVPDNSVEMAYLPARIHDTAINKNQVGEESHAEDDIGGADGHAANEREAPGEAVHAAKPADEDGKVDAVRNDFEEKEDNDLGLSSQHSVPPAPPSFMPLPFKVPNLESKSRNDNDDAHSMQAVVDDDDDKDAASVRTSKRKSATSLFRRLSQITNANRRSGLMQSESDEMLVPPSAVNDESSGQETAQGEQAGFLLEESRGNNMDIHVHNSELTLKEGGSHSPFDFDEAQKSNTIPQTAATDDKTDAISSTGRKTFNDAKNNEEESENMSPKRRHTVDGGTLGFSIKELSPDLATNHSSEIRDSTSKQEEPNVDKVPAPLFTSNPESNTIEKEHLTTNAVETIPSHVSQLVMSYRTNEWAKHLSHADVPEPEPLNVANTDVEQQISPEDIQIAAPVDLKALEQTALTASPPPANEGRVPVAQTALRATVKRSISIKSKESDQGVNSRHLSGDESLINVQTPPLDPVVEIDIPISPILRHSSSRSPPEKSNAIPGGLRSVSSPHLSSKLTAQPTVKNETRHSLGQIMEDKSHSLMAQRERMIQARHSSVSLAHESSALWNPSRLSIQSILEETETQQPRSGNQMSMLQDDNMPLTQRRVLLQQKPLSPPPPRSATPLLGMDPNTRRSPIERFPSTARLSRESSKQKMTTMAAWRESLQEDLTRHNPLLEVDIAQNELMKQQQKAQVAKSQRMIASENLDNSIAERMRHGDMQDLHREAMRRMQAAANQRTKQ